jgi:hypothetical protein
VVAIDDEDAFSQGAEVQHRGADLRSHARQSPKPRLRIRNRPGLEEVETERPAPALDHAKRRAELRRLSVVVRHGMEATRQSRFGKPAHLPPIRKASTELQENLARDRALRARANQGQDQLIHGVELNASRERPVPFADPTIDPLQAGAEFACKRVLHRRPD